MNALTVVDGMLVSPFTVVDVTLATVANGTLALALAVIGADGILALALALAAMAGDVKILVPAGVGKVFAA